MFEFDLGIEDNVVCNLKCRQQYDATSVKAVLPSAGSFLATELEFPISTYAKSGIAAIPQAEKRGRGGRAILGDCSQGAGLAVFAGPVVSCFCYFGLRFDRSFGRRRWRILFVLGQFLLKLVHLCRESLHLS